MNKRIRELKKQLGDQLIIPAHHYQKQEIIACADIIGDSYKLAVDVSSIDAEYIVFCGVKFMAEGAAILAKEHQRIILPASNAGCPMADMISIDQAETAMQNIHEFCGQSAIPVVYMNAYGDLKALSGRYGGSVCTSSNAQKIMTHYLQNNTPVFFLPDYCLGINTARELSIPDEQIAIVRQDCTIETTGKPEDIKLFLWDGNCRVHQRFTTEHIERIRDEHPGIRVIVHPEVREQVAAAADYAGSTQYIYNTIQKAPAGTIWGVGTEYNFVSRVAADFPEKSIFPIFESHCSNMEKTTINNLQYMLEAIADDTLLLKYPDHIISVPESIRKDAALSLNNMISIVQEN
ncbi:quinolinate synthase NadA [Pleomorphochaeta sp. DL1XJH-081]|jgi:quinolinate synthase|uniref:quinolinate synthase NadA n=1 Tax=Pleomorphochaeta sp. DL1XJH-081 TaxID=3409690 RepID=UPI003BB55E27